MEYDKIFIITVITTLYFIDWKGCGAFADGTSILYYVCCSFKAANGGVKKILRAGLLVSSLDNT